MQAGAPGSGRLWLVTLYTLNAVVSVRLSLSSCQAAAVTFRGRTAQVAMVHFAGGSAQCIQTSGSRSCLM